ncbi:unnamed protein product [Darwinula stevensoni]|uniref:non-specific serine/threonine protein kinase n=1 Tax=Darwinula stevensoni TaxID=69355 RepID=A0A7R9A4E0_9CRUS|nr:unnamed protein product [Darwinula stevensoni]CAG0889811.1 unnamed protein product [Darwinula stevensoni]
MKTQSEAAPADLHRLLIASNRVRNLNLIGECLRLEVTAVLYRYDSDTLQSILDQVGKRLNGVKVESVAFLMHGTENGVYLTGPKSKVLNMDTVMEDEETREFFKSLVTRHVARNRLGSRLDFLACPIALERDGGLLAREMEILLDVTVGMSKDLFGADIQVSKPYPDKDSPMTVGELYFHVKKLKDQLKQAARVTTMGAKVKDLSRYERIRQVGKGAFGTAVLYRRMDDDTQVVIKEINMHDLSASERHLALNEIQVLALLDHPNIIRYLDSFERDGVLMIEMEYADNGTLASWLAQLTRRLEEREILVVFHQIVSAIRHIHQHNILHRDLKTANIFLTKNGIVKVGDFGISKMLTTRQGGANTVLGTPYYISPEMCEEKQYDEKSDIWALGCILYEMACLHKTFEGSNLPALVNKIMKGQFAPIRGNYSPLFKQLVRDLLQREPEFRPTAAEILYTRMPELLISFDQNELDRFDSTSDPEFRNALAAVQLNVRSVLYYIKAYQNQLHLEPIRLPPRSRINQVCVATTHIVALTAELLVFTWGEGKRGQLGHEMLENWRAEPTCVESLKGKAITKIGAGDGFSIFASDNGIAMSCGDGTSGCLGHGDWNSSSKPKLIEQLLSVDVNAVACGNKHVVIVGSEGDVYSWGKGEGGRLGLGHEDDCQSPTPVTVPPDVQIQSVRCGGDGTIFLTERGIMFACGNNARNKLGLNPPTPLISLRKQNEKEKALVPTPCASVQARVVDVAMSSYHTAVLTETGTLVTFGRNSDGQLGRGHSRPTTSPGSVKGMSDKVVTMIACGATFTVVGTLENTLYMWGTRYVSPNSRPSTQDAFESTFGMNRGESSSRPSSESSTSSLLKNVPEVAYSGGSQRGSLFNEDIILRDVVLDPQEILA